MPPVLCEHTSGPHTGDAMKDSYETYRDAVRDVWKGWWLAWPLSRRVELGDVFASVDGRVRQAGTLADRGIAADLRPGTPCNDYTYDTQGSASVRFKPAGAVLDGFGVLGAADAGALVEFRQDNAALIVYTGLTETGLRNIPELAATLVQRVWNDTWDPSLLAVTDVVTAASGIIVTAAQSGAFAEVRLRAEVGQGQLQLAHLSGHMGFADAKHLGLKWTSTDATPFFHVVRIRKDWLGRLKKDYGPRQTGRGAAAVSVPPLLLEEAHDDPGAVLETVPPQEQSPFGASHSS
ncbi:hypothetical protein [Streptomyces sp. 8N706]|uniref:hypothetical protein n=1 Tax=Streptomyces sp. 8N706 TaxID=3457416 RepID=UPI003FD22EE5